MKLCNRMVLVFGSIYVAVAVVIVILVNYNMRQQALLEAKSKALMLLDHNLAIHTYFTHELKPAVFAVSKTHQPPDFFDPIWMSSTYAVRDIDRYFNELTQEEYYYKECAINARNPQNEADQYEQTFLKELNKGPEVVERSEIRDFNGKPFLVTMRRGEVMEASCLRCHSTPELAPGNLVKLYGPTRSFGRRLGEVTDAISIRIPLAEAYGEANYLSLKLSAILLSLLGGLFFGQIWISKRWLCDPMAAIRHKALEIAASETQLGETIPEPSNSELRDLTVAFNTMSKNLRLSYDSLEERVRLRTEELNRLNVRLEEDIHNQQRAAQEKAEMEARLAQAQKMEAIGTLAGGIAHDFNNILWAIMGFSELTLNSLPEGSREHRNIQQVLQASERARDLVNQILAFSRKADQEKQPLQIALIIKEALKLLRATIPATIEIKQDIAAPDALVLADPTQVHQIIMNLCTNAAQAMQESGNTLEVKLEEAYLEPGVRADHQNLAPGPYVKLSVRDNGPGIPPDIIDKIFEPFFTTKGVGQGTGMGLASVYGIVKAHGGAITAYSRPGEGAVFTVLLPKIIAQKPADQEAKTSLPTGHGRILVIDDEKMLVEMNERMLGSLGYEVTPATSSIEALAIFQAKPDTFDLVITDQTMPHMDGLQLSREFRRIRPDLPIILCTGFSAKVSPETVTASGLDALLKKPVTLQDFAETVKKVLDKRAPFMA